MRAHALRSIILRVRSSELGGLAGDSFYVGIWQGATSVAYFAQIALITHALGLHEYGRLALVTSFVILIGQFFDVRVGAAATTFGAAKVRGGDFRGAAGIFQLSYLVDVSTGLLAFGLLAALAPFAGPRLVGGNGTVLVLLYGLTLLASTADDSSIAILRLLDRFRLIATYTVGLEALRVVFIVIALLVSKSLVGVLIALVAHDVVQAGANAIAAAWAFHARTARSLSHRALDAIAEKRRFLRMTLHTNLVSYARLAQVQLPTVLLGALTNATQVGIYSIGTGAAGAVGRLADLPYAAVLPRVSRLWAAGRQQEVRILVQRATLAMAALLGTALGVLLLLSGPALRLLAGHEGDAAAMVLLLAGLAQALNGVLFWNAGVLYVAEKSAQVATIAAAGIALQIGLLLPLVVLFGATGAAAAFLSSIAATNIAATVLALRALPSRAQADHDSPQLRTRSIPLTPTRAISQR